MRRRIAAGILLAAAAGCSEAETPAVAPPRVEALSGPSPPRPRTPDGEVPPDSRIARDESGAPASAFVGFDYAFPGPPGSLWHYHVRVPDAGAASAVPAGFTAGAPVSVRTFRVASASDAAAAAKQAIAGIVEYIEVLDPASAGGCGAEAGHSGAAGTRRVPTVRVVRARGTRDYVTAAERRAAALSGQEPLFRAELGGTYDEDAWLDLHFVER